MLVMVLRTLENYSDAAEYTRSMAGIDVLIKATFGST
jgi:hypothetical protein